MAEMRRLFGLALRDVRRSMGMTQQEFGELLYGEAGFSRRNRVLELEKGRRNMRFSDADAVLKRVGRRLVITITLEEI